MRLMLVSTHQALMQSLQDVHAAQQRVLQTKLDYALEKLSSCQAGIETLIAEKRGFIRTVASQQETIKTAMTDLVILKGAGRIRNEQEKPVELAELRPDVEITDAPTDLEGRRQLVGDARRIYDEAIAALDQLKQEVDVSNVSPAAVAAAIPESPEAWRAEHAQPTDENVSDLVAGG